MSALELSGVEYAVRDASRPLLVLGPSLGSVASSLWSEVGPSLSVSCDVIAWDLPGHGASAPAEEFTIGEVADAVVRLADRAQQVRGDSGAPFAYAGVSIGGAVGLELLLRYAGRVPQAVLLATAARIGTPDMWRLRADQVRASGTASLVESSAERWFAPGFTARYPRRATHLLDDLAQVDDVSYAAACEALGGFDVTGELSSITGQVTCVAGGSDAVTPAAGMQPVAAASQGEVVELAGVAHLPPVEDPESTTAVLSQMLGGAPAPFADRRRSQARRDGMRVRRQVLSDAHVDQAEAGKTEFTADFQDFITRYAWGEVWNRPGLDRRTRSAITLTALIAGGHWEEFEMHVRAAVGNGLSHQEIREVLLQSAVYCSVPSANRAFALAQRVLVTD